MNKQLLARANKLIERNPALYGFRRGDVDELIALSSAILGKSVCRGCPGEHVEIFNELRTLINNQLNPKSETLMKNEEEVGTGMFILPEGRVLHDMVRGKAFTNDNLTDDEALDLLSRNPRAIRQFKKAPKDWEAKVKDYESRKPRPVKKVEPAEDGKGGKPKAGGKSSGAAKPGKPGKPGAKKPAAGAATEEGADDDQDTGSDDEPQE